ncbi:MAG: MFS transporter, partial [Actinobacteria bacterium]
SYVLLGGLVWLGFGAFGALEPLYFRDTLHTQVSAIGWVNAVFAIGMIAGSALLTRLPARTVSARGLALMSVLTGLGALLYLAWPDVRLTAAGGFVWAIAIGILDPLSRTLIHRDTPHKLVGRVVGAGETLRTFGELAPLAVAPAAAALLGVRETMIAGGLLTAALSAATWFEARTVDRLTAGAAPVPIAPAHPSGEPLSPNP